MRNKEESGEPVCHTKVSGPSVIKAHVTWQADFAICATYHCAPAAAIRLSPLARPHPFMAASNTLHPSDDSSASCACCCRDVKPENLLLRMTPPCNQSSAGKCAEPDPSQIPGGPPGVKPSRPVSVGDLHVRLIDFGSAVDKHSIEQLYGSEGPSDDEQTAEYGPPEALLARCEEFLL